MSIRPLQDRVVIRRQEEEATSAGGIVLPGNTAEKPNQGEVLAVGPGRVSVSGDIIAMNVKVGDKVLFGPYAGNSTAKINGEEVLIVSESEIFGILEA
jgi:chaperonin GroES